MWNPPTLLQLHGPVKVAMLHDSDPQSNSDRIRQRGYYYRDSGYNKQLGDVNSITGSMADEDEYYPNASHVINDRSGGAGGRLSPGGGEGGHNGEGDGRGPGNIEHFLAMQRPVPPPIPHPRLEKVGPSLTIAALQAYTILTVVRCLADPTWIVVKGHDNTGAPTESHVGELGTLERAFLACAIAFTVLSCLGVTLRILDKLPWLKKIPVITAYLEAIFCAAALGTFLSTHSLPPGGQFSHGFLACVITVLFSTIVALMLTVDWWRGFPSPGLTATLKALILSSFVMTTMIIISSAIYVAVEEWSFDDAVNFCIVSFATIGYGNLSPKTPLGQSLFFFLGLLGISSMGFFVVSLRNAVIEQFQWRLVEQFSKPAHLTRVQTRMSAKDIPFPIARLEEEQQVKVIVKRKMIVRMLVIWVMMWFGGAGIFCAFEEWTYLESLYFCFVTLTTIGFGDYVPKEPGSIEFWNVYVFIGLSVFAYILSLSSESMASHIHLVDDQDDDDDMYGWERNEDPNAPLTTRSGVLGMEGLKWVQQQQQLRQQQEREGSLNGDAGGPRTRPISIASGGGRGGDNGDGDTGSFGGGGSARQGSSANEGSPWKPNRNRRQSRILMVSSKERKQMLQAEYYASHSVPSTIRFVDTAGRPHQRRVTGIGGGPGSDYGAANQGTIWSDPRQATIQHAKTIGYYGTIGRGDLYGTHGYFNRIYGPSITRSQTRPTSEEEGEMSSHAVGGDSPRPKRRDLSTDNYLSTDGDGGARHGRLASAQVGGTSRQYQQHDSVGADHDRDSRSGYIPSCRDLFKSVPNSATSKASTLLSPQVTQVRSPSPSSALRSSMETEVRPTDDSRHTLASGGSTIVTISPSGEGGSNQASSTPHQQLEGAIVPDELAPDQLYLGGGPAAGYGPFAYGMPPSSTPSPSIMSPVSSRSESITGSSTALHDSRSPLLGNASHGSPMPNIAEVETLTVAVDVPGQGDRQQSVSPPILTETQATPTQASVLSSIHPDLHEDDLEQEDVSYSVRGAPSLAPSLFSNHPGTLSQRSSLVGTQTVRGIGGSGESQNHHVSTVAGMHGGTGAVGRESPFVSPAGSRTSSRAPSVLMTIFDEPVPVESLGSSRPGSRSASRPVSRTPSLTGVGHHYQHGYGQGYGQNQPTQHVPPPPSIASAAVAAAASPTPAATRPLAPSPPRGSSDAGSTFSPRSSILYQQSSGSSSSSNNNNRAQPSSLLPTQGDAVSDRSRNNSATSAVSDASVGPFDETRSATTLPAFDQDVDLNKVCPSDEQCAQIARQERAFRRELRRREQELERQMALQQQQQQGQQQGQGQEERGRWPEQGVSRQDRTEEKQT